MIDWPHVRKLQQDVGADDFSEIVALYFSEVEDAFDRIREKGLTATDMHLLKGSAANMGFVAFSKACQIAEHALQNAGVECDIDAVTDSYNDSVKDFLNGLEQEAST
ncbi:Hpt domain-containing protein [Cognatishimia maritima]|uniref:HPt (Histidine-containing phosphotransfer) domain-containing protein n=1 Tax=Cognatishimia maritima TaxID=870908 RepID=A0A1M5PB96_9RHOB|nr:Hpt domain-containing protein [Cognatishimia maritima]SHG99111.1 HPt (histidine-containing phosphotransfer) domain-containing protein [Cognatishimia maritima]